jgi:hypothetical protein
MGNIATPPHLAQIDRSILVLAIIAFGSNYAETSSCKHVALQSGAQQIAGSRDPGRGRFWSWPIGPLTVGMKVDVYLRYDER